MTKVLLINSDLATNRGDRAIAEGNIELIKRRFPDAQITGLSEQPARDRKWFGIDFLDMNFQSLSPIAFIRLARAVRRHDIVLWGGGEILKDYTNKAALWYWVIKMSLLSHVNPNLYGAYQGIGPTKSDFSKRLIAHVVNRCHVFIVRDQESADKLVEWGADPAKVRAASDPAVLPFPAKIDRELANKLTLDYGIDEAFLENFICIGPRDWFHYKPGGIIPFKYKKKFYKALGRSINTETPQHTLYLEQLTALVRQLIDQYPDTHLLLAPMHMGENDSELCRQLRTQSTAPDRVRVLDQDNLSPSELRSVIGSAQTMVGFRLHSNIIGISAGVPSMNIYYVDKGRVFFDQIKQSAYAMPIEHILDTNFLEDFAQRFGQLYRDRAGIKQQIAKATDAQRKSVVATFDEVFHD